MTITLTVSPEPLADRPRVRLDVVSTNVSPNAVNPNSLVTLYRTNADGRRFPVIIEADARLSGGAGTWYDYHAPFEQQVSYSIVAGAVDQSGVQETGYWNYAPAPNLLSSQIAGLGNSGNPLENGWSVTTGSLAKSGTDLKVTPALIGFAYYGIPGTTFLEPWVTYIGLPVTVQIKIRNSAASYQEAEIGLTWLDAAGYAISSIIVAGAAEMVPSEVRTFSATGTVPVGTVLARLECGSNFYTPSGVGSALIEDVMVELGPSASAFPAPEWIELDLPQTVLTSEETWLISPTSPMLSTPVHAVKDLSSTNQPTQAGLQAINGRRNPIAISSGRRAGVRGSIVVRSDSGPLDDAIRALLDSDGPILINPQGGFERDLPWLWVQPGDIELRNPGEYTGYPYRHFAIPFTEVDQPEVYSGSLWTCQNVVDTYATCADVVAAYSTALDLQTDTRAA